MEEGILSCSRFLPDRSCLDQPSALPGRCSDSVRHTKTGTLPFVREQGKEGVRHMVESLWMGGSALRPCRGKYRRTHPSAPRASSSLENPSTFRGWYSTFATDPSSGCFAAAPTSRWGRPGGGNPRRSHGRKVRKMEASYPKTQLVTKATRLPEDLASASRSLVRALERPTWFQVEGLHVDVGRPLRAETDDAGFLHPDMMHRQISSGSARCSS
jgi:hypothetical protein